MDQARNLSHSRKLDLVTRQTSVRMRLYAGSIPVLIHQYGLLVNR